MGWFFKKKQGAWLLFVGLLSFCLNLPASARYAAVVMDAHTGQMVHAEHPDKIIHPASLTKMMTLYKAFQALSQGRLTFKQQLPVSKFAAGQAPCKLGLRAGQTVSVKDAMMGLITKSANDAAVVLAEALAGNEVQFAGQMTAQARQLGMNHTVFKNASGLPNRAQVSTARDMAKLSQALILHFPNYYGYFAAKDFHFKGQRHHNHNHLLGEVIGYGHGGPIIIDGIKTGFVNASGFNLAASAKHSNQRLIGVVVGGENRHWRDRRMKQLLSWAFGVVEGQPRIINASATSNAPPPIMTLATPSKTYGKPAVKRWKKATPKATAAAKPKAGKPKPQKATPKKKPTAKKTTVAKKKSVKAAKPKAKWKPKTKPRVRAKAKPRVKAKPKAKPKAKRQPRAKKAVRKK